MSTDPRIREAIQLIRDGKKAEAQILIDGLLRQSPNDADLWYLAAGAAEGSKRIDHLRRALAVDPHHAKAQAMLNKLAPSMTNLPPIAPVAARSKSNLPLMLAGLAIVLLLIAASGFGGYQIGHEAGLRSLGNTMAVAFYGNEASQTAYPPYRETVDARYDATRSAIENEYGATSTAMYLAYTAEAQIEFATQTAAAPKLISSITDVTILPGKYETAKWLIEVEISPLDDKTESTARLSSDDTDIYNRSWLSIECKKSEFTVHFDLDSVYAFSDQEIQIRLDKEPARILKPTEYTGLSFIGLASPRAFLSSLAGHDQLVIAVGEFTPVTFTITNVDIASAFPLKTCGF